jgi:hypothetical protein
MLGKTFIQNRTDVKRRLCSCGRHPEIIGTKPMRESFFAWTFAELIVPQCNLVFRTGSMRVSASNVEANHVSELEIPRPSRGAHSERK